MEKLDVRIIKLEPMRIICFNGYGQEPEKQSFNKLLDWAKAKGLIDDGQPHRFFGYNNPNPSEGTPNYGYDTWISVDESVQPEGEARLIKFSGGLYAVTRCEVGDPYGDIPGTWHKLVTWMENSRYHHGNHQWLEEHLSLPGQGRDDGFVLDLYLPIAE